MRNALNLGRQTLVADSPPEPRVSSFGVEPSKVIADLVLVGWIESANGKVLMMSEMDHRLVAPIADVGWASTFGRR
ncbi:hypothetical protein SAMN06265380_11288 [Ruegeria faecimaris]|uniref:Uncharacterized protein n=1 Tax=Ruegeria faecimaris TaxID=686389 RepID=A0A521EN84_9RHOB|nr:hypothetical protein SAMN06265380_11288 [Ruegeria faecimaris]